MKPLARTEADCPENVILTVLTAEERNLLDSAGKFPGYHVYPISGREKMKHLLKAPIPHFQTGNDARTLRTFRETGNACFCCPHMLTLRLKLIRKLGLSSFWFHVAFNTE